MNHMVSLEEVEIMLNEMAALFPQEIYKELNGGIVLLPDVKLNNLAKKNDLYIMGEYHGGGNMGRYIIIYYGSFMKVYGYMEKEQLRERLLHTLKHEFTHHLESLAGEKDLEIKDANYIRDYLKRRDR
ncbi:MAG: metallopeptidase family protein [Clostridia bacterium]|nr:metallopeptidase family protein [Clostridia bacterium]